MTGLMSTLTVDDLPGCLELARDRDWPPEDRKWRLLFDLGTVYGIRDPDRGLLGTAILTRFGGDLSVVGMVVVATRVARQGLGRNLMARVLATVTDGTTFLCATDLSRPLYEKLGFTPVDTLHTHVGRLSGTTGNASRSRPATPDDLPAMVSLDAEVNGADRRRLVLRLMSFADQVRVIPRGGNIDGYGAAWRNIDHTVLGPVIAADDADAEALIRELAAGTDDPVRIDLADKHQALRKWVTRGGLRSLKSAPVMIRGAKTLPGDRSRWYGPVMQALG